LTRSFYCWLIASEDGHFRARSTHRSKNETPPDLERILLLLLATTVAQVVGFDQRGRPGPALVATTALQLYAINEDAVL